MGIKITFFTLGLFAESCFFLLGVCALPASLFVLLGGRRAGGTKRAVKCEPREIYVCFWSLCKARSQTLQVLPRKP